MLPTAWAMSFRYAPPEQFRYGEKHLDFRSDIYSLGATTYAVLTSHYPPSAIERMISKTAVIMPRRLNSNISSETEEAILKAIQLEPHQRYASVDDFQRALLFESSE